MRGILIDDQEVEPRECTYGFPWKYDATCFNFKVPEELIMVQDIQNLRDKAEIETLVIGCDLDSYDFIAEMKNLRQLYIYSGNRLEHLDFLQNLVRLQQIYIADSHVKDLSPVVHLLQQKKSLLAQEKSLGQRMILGMQGICIETDADNLDEKELLEPGVHISEVIIRGAR